MTQGDPQLAKAGLKKDWTPTPEAFHQLLAWLDEGVDSGGERYLEMRGRLASYFARKGCRSPDELADDVLNRVARRLFEEGSIVDAAPARYCYIVAKFVFLESLRNPEHSRVDLPSSELSDAEAVPESPDLLLECLERCLAQLPSADRDLILEYYRGEHRLKIERRRAMAVRLAMTLNALSIRACRIRGKLEQCVSACASRQ